MAYSGDEPGEQWLLRSEPAEAAAVDGLSLLITDLNDFELQFDTTLLLNYLGPLLLIADTLPVNINTKICTYDARCIHLCTYRATYYILDCALLSV